MSIHTDFDTALYTRLTTTAGTALWGQRVYAGQAPHGATLPYVVFDAHGGGDLNVSPSRIVDLRYRIEVIATAAADARQGADYLDAALPNQPLTVTGWTHLGTTHLAPISRTENVEGHQFWHRGALYRVRASK
jgi:hypothetical protein